MEIFDMAQTRVVINCVALYYTKGASGTNYIKKEKFRAEIPRDETNLRTLKNIIRYGYFLSVRCLAIQFYNFEWHGICQIWFKSWLYISFRFYSGYGGIKDVAKKAGLCSNVDIKMARMSKPPSGPPECFAINTDVQAKLEMQSIITGTDSSQRK